MSKQKKLGQFNTKPDIAKSIVGYTRFNKNVDVLEPSSGSGNFVNALKDEGYSNIDFFELDKKYEHTGAKICDFLKEPITKKYDFIIGNPPYSSRKQKNSFYEGKFIEKLFIIKAFELLKQDGEIWFILPNRIFTDKTFKDLRENFYKFNIFPHTISEMSPHAFEIDHPLNSLLVKFKHGKTKKVFTPIGDIDFSKLAEVGFNYQKAYTEKRFTGKHSLGDFIRPHKFPKPEDAWKISIANMETFDEKTIEDYKEYYMLVARVGNSSAGKFIIVDTDYFNMNDCFYTFKIEKGFEKLIRDTMTDERFHIYINILSSRVGQKSIKIDDILSYKF